MSDSRVTLLYSQFSRYSNTIGVWRSSRIFNDYSDSLIWIRKIMMVVMVTRRVHSHGTVCLITFAGCSASSLPPVKGSPRLLLRYIYSYITAVYVQNVLWKYILNKFIRITIPFKSIILTLLILSCDTN